MTTPARNFFKDLFVLEMANNHWGDVERGLQIIAEFAAGRPVQQRRGRRSSSSSATWTRFIHKDLRDRDDIRYIKKTIDTQLSQGRAARARRGRPRRATASSCATPFDEASVRPVRGVRARHHQDRELGHQRLGPDREDRQDAAAGDRLDRRRRRSRTWTTWSRSSTSRNIPLAINHCVSIYPTEDSELELNQIDFLRNRYPGHAIGFSTHEYKDWTCVGA